MTICTAHGCSVETTDRFCSTTCEDNTCAASDCKNPARQFGTCSPRCLQKWTSEHNATAGDPHDPRVDPARACQSCARNTHPKPERSAPTLLSWLGETYRPTVAGWFAADGTRVCCDQAMHCHPWPCPWHPAWGGWPLPQSAVGSVQYATVEKAAS